MSRSPVLSNFTPALRIVSKANGLWQVEEFIGRPTEANPRHTSPWRGIGRRASVDECRLRLTSLEIARGYRYVA